MPPRLVRQERVLGIAVVEPGDVVRQHFLQEVQRRRAVHVDLAHVRHVEGAAVRADRPVLLDDPLVLNGHLPPGEGNHSRARFEVARVQRRALQRGLHDGDDSSDSRPPCDRG